MNYKFTFEKISPQHEFAGVGFAGNIFIILNALSVIGDDDLLFVDMETNDCVCTEKDLILYDTKNCWEYYFNQVKLGKDFSNLDFRTPSILNYESKTDFLVPENFIRLKHRFYKSFKPKQYLIDFIDDFYCKNLKNKVTLAVQIRLTDMLNHHNVSPLNRYLEKINEILKENEKIEQIFLATDDNSVIKTLKNEIKIPIIFHENMSRADVNKPNLNPYDRYKSSREQHKYKLGMECLIEILTMSKCDFLLKADKSALSITSVILSDNLQKIYAT